MLVIFRKNNRGRSRVCARLGDSPSEGNVYRGKMAYPDRHQWKNPPKPGEIWDVRVVGENKKGSVAFLAPVALIATPDDFVVVPEWYGYPDYKDVHYPRIAKEDRARRLKFVETTFDWVKRMAFYREMTPCVQFGKPDSYGGSLMYLSPQLAEAWKKKLWDNAVELAVDGWEDIATQDEKERRAELLREENKKREEAEKVRKAQCDRLRSELQDIERAIAKYENNPRTPSDSDYSHWKRDYDRRKEARKNTLQKLRKLEG